MIIEELYNHTHKLADVPMVVRSFYIFPALIGVLFFNSVVFNLNLIVIFLLLTLFITRIQVRKVLRLYSIPLVFIAFGCLTIASSFDSIKPFISIGHFHLGFDRENVKLALFIFSRSIAIVCIVFFGLLTHTVSEIATSMKFIGLPHLFIEIFILTYKFIINLAYISKEMYTAQLSRQGYMNKRNNISSFTCLLSGIFRRAIQQANYLAIAIDARSGGNSFCFVSKEKSFKKQQLISPALLLLLLVVLFLIERRYGK